MAAKKKSGMHKSRATKKGAASKSVRAAQKRGCSLKDIARKAGRDPSTISAIKSGKITNPPKSVKKAITSCKK